MGLFLSSCGIPFLFHSKITELQGVEALTDETALLKVPRTVFE